MCLLYVSLCVDPFHNWRWEAFLLCLRTQNTMKNSTDLTKIQYHHLKWSRRVIIISSSFSNAVHSMMSWNLTSKKTSTETEYWVWKLLSCSFTYQSKKSHSVAPVRKITKPPFRKWNHWMDKKISIINE